LTPGKTTIAESEDVLRSLSFVSVTSIETSASFGVTSTSWIFKEGVAGRGRLVFDAQGQVSEIRLNTRGLRLGMLIDAFGSPDRIWAAHTLSNDGIIIYQMLLFYPNSGIAASVVAEPGNVPGQNRERITRDLLVDQVQFYEPMSVEAFLKSIDQRSQENVRYLLDHLQPWPGFGDSVIDIESP
jgi:hypothetical protein